jgi:hypothetical protein
MLTCSRLPVSDESLERFTDESDLSEVDSLVIFGGSLQHPPGLPHEKLVLTTPSDIYEISEHSLSCKSSTVSPDIAILPFKSSVIKVFAACKIGLYPVHRHKFPSRWPSSSISLSVNRKVLVAGSYEFLISA